MVIDDRHFGAFRSNLAIHQKEGLRRRTHWGDIGQVRSIRNSEFNHRQLESFAFGPMALLRTHSLVHEASEIGQDVRDDSNACRLVFRRGDGCA